MNPRHKLNVIYGKTLRALAGIPQEAAYRKYTEEIVRERAAIVEKVCDLCCNDTLRVNHHTNFLCALQQHLSEILLQHSDVSAIEKEIGCGQIEEVLVQAENELRLARKMVVWKPWEPLVTSPEPNQWTWPPAK